MVTSARIAVRIGLIAALALAGRAAMDRREAADTEGFLAAARLQARPADSPEWLDHPKAVPPRTRVVWTSDGLRYTFANVDEGRCRHGDEPEECAADQRLAEQEPVAERPRQPVHAPRLW